jgi:hypothetical protein
MQGLMLNEDCNHYYVNRRDSNPGIQEVDAWADQYAGTQVTELVMNVNAMRTSYGSKVWEPFWHGYDPEGGDDQPFLKEVAPSARERTRKWIHTAWSLHNDGIDLFARWIERNRVNGISSRLSMRMNDIHSVDEEGHPLHSSFWRNRPDLRRVPYRFSDWTDRALDYGNEEVRDRAFSLIQEMLERYDTDGLELDWMRFTHHFKPGFEQEGAIILTDFMTKVRTLCDEWEQKRGHQISLSARVPSRPHTSLGLGMDAVEWARRGLIDLLVVTPFWATIETDMPIEQWKRLLDNTGVRLAAGLEVLIRAYPASKLRQTNSLETVRGAAASLLSRGADSIYLFNYMDSDTTIEDLSDYPQLVREVGSLETLVGKPRRHVVTYADTWAPGEPTAIALPIVCAIDSHASLRLHLGPKPETSEAEIRIGVQEGEVLGEDSCEIRLNGAKCAFVGTHNLRKPRPEGLVYSFRIPQGAAHAGYNVIDLAAKGEFTVIWAEIVIR